MMQAAVVPRVDLVNAETYSFTSILELPDGILVGRYPIVCSRMEHSTSAREAVVRQ